jgi:hypothetical protein
MEKQTSRWPSTKARLVLAALLRKRLGDQTPERITSLAHEIRLADYTFAYHDRAELGRGALELLGKKTGLRPKDL